MTFERFCTMKRYTDGYTVRGYIELDHIIDPKSLKVYLGNQRLYPENFDAFGHPIFSTQVVNMYTWKAEQASRYNKENKLYLRVTYRTREYKPHRADCDIRPGIESSLRDIKSFNEMLTARKFLASKHNLELNEFVVLGKYILDSFGQVLTIKNLIGPGTSEMVCLKEDFVQKNEFRAVYGALIPKPEDVCSCCGKKFSMNDIKNELFEFLDGRIVHESCAKEYEHYQVIDKLTRLLVDVVYEDKPKYDELPNGYCKDECCKHKPWLLFHTVNGDVEIGFRKRVISIEWKDNFKPFDMAIFNGEQVTKWTANGSFNGDIKPDTTPKTGCRGIHAWSLKEAIKYLEIVKKADLRIR